MQTVTTLEAESRKKMPYFQHKILVKDSTLNEKNSTAEDPWHNWYKPGQKQTSKTDVAVLAEQ